MKTLDRPDLSLALPAKRDNTRPVVRGKFLFVGDEKFYVRGTTYGTFAIDESGAELHDPATVERDFGTMRAAGFNAVRTYTVPPRWMLDTAHRHGLRVMVGLPWEEHVAFLDDPKRARDIERRVREAVRQCAHHPAILCYTVGNEIPANVVRWLGRHRVERFVERLYRAVKSEDAAALVTYVNYPTTEYLQLPCLDFVCFNVYLETQRGLSDYLARLQNLAGDRPLVMAEIGLDSRRNGEERQAAVLDWQLRTIFEAGCAGAFVYAWTDEWHRGGYPILDWDFGLTRRDRSAKAALSVVREAFTAVPFRRDVSWPSVSVVVCAYNARPTIRQCLEGLARVDYPNFEVIVVDDGSTDGTGAIAGEYAVRLISTPNRGLSNARNTGLEAATGEIVAYLDSDAYPDPDWLKYLAAAFAGDGFVGAGGPNLAPPGLGRTAECFDNAPGGPVHVLLSDREAEHIPGCNMAFLRKDLAAIGGFDGALRVAGDDVDICWRLQDRGGHLGFAPGAMVWHHRRTTLRSYWKQQRGYGRAEALLERKWPEKYNSIGHLTWGGRIYSKGAAHAGSGRDRIYAGTWGAAAFQSLERGAPGPLASMAQMPEWYLLAGVLAVLSALGALWPPLLFAVPLLVVAIALPLARSVAAARNATFETPLRSRGDALRARGLVALLHFAQPIARLAGRIEFGLTAWRSSVTWNLLAVRPRASSLWSDRWYAAATWLETLERQLRAAGAVTARGSDYDRWDLEVRGGSLGSARAGALIEDHGGGKQLARFRWWPTITSAAPIMTAFFATTALAAGANHAWAASAVLGAVAVGIALRTVLECATAMARFECAIGGLLEILDRQR